VIEGASKVRGKIQQIQGLIAEGKVDSARHFFASIPLNKLPRPLLVEAADLARRLSLPLVAIQILNPVVRPQSRKPIRPNEQEKAEYAGCLIAIGAGAEGEILLNQVDEAVAPQSLLYRAFYCFSQWRYGEAIPFLKRYLDSSSLSEYQLLVGRVNLAAALVNDGGNTSLPDLLKEIRLETTAKSFHRLGANALELSAQLAVARGSWDEALGYLDQAERLFDSTKTLDSFFVHKWRTLVETLKSKGSGESLQNLARLRETASVRAHWETVRECDLYQSIATGDSELALHVYFGTPFEGYRQRMLRVLPFILNIPEYFDLELGKQKIRQQRLDLRTPLIGTQQEGEALKGKLYDLMSCLASDFYRPFRVASLFSHLYPTDHYHPQHSPQRIYQLLRRLRRRLESSRLSLMIVESKSTYRLKSQKGICLRVSRRCGNGNTRKLRLDELRRHFHDEEFTAEQASQTLRTSQATALRLLKSATERERITKIGAGPSCRYKVA